MLKSTLKIAVVSMLLLVISISPLFAQYPLNDEGKSPFVQVVKDVRESVVNIKVEVEVEYGQTSPFNDEFFRFFFPDMPKQNQPRSRKSTQMGSGFIFKQEGKELYIITNNHVVENGKDGVITVTLADKDIYKAEIIGLDKETDLAVIKITLEENHPVTVVPLGNSDNIDVGDWAIAIGNPFGQLGLERTVTVGVISAMGRSNLYFGGDSPLYQDYIQTDAAINPGNSGGPLLNLKGEVIGVNAAITSTSGGNVGIGFAIPINLATKVTSDLINRGSVVRGYIGILPQEIDYDLRKSLDLEETAGVLVAKVEKDTPAEDAGLKNGDVIISFNGVEIPNVAKFRIEVANSDIGKKIPLEIIRKKKNKTLWVTLVPRPDAAIAEQEIKESEKSENLGMEVENLDGDFAKTNNIDEEEGIIITSVAPNTGASEAGLKAGDIILEINQEAVKDLDDFDRIIDKYSDEEILLLYIKTSDDSYRFVTLSNR